MKNRKYICIISMLILSFFSMEQVSGNTTTHPKGPSVIKFTERLQRLSRSGVMFGHQDDTFYGIGWQYIKNRSDVKLVCGDYPAVMGYELGNIELGDEKNLDGVPFTLIKEEIIKQHKRGGINTISWHANNPVTGKDAWDNTTNETVASVLKGGVNHEKFLDWMSRVADFLNSLRCEDGSKIPVIFRPWHEHTGSWFWWGQDLCTAEQYKALWYMLNEYLASKGVDNIIYAYSPGIEPQDEKHYLERYPGDEYIDLLGVDFYYRNKHDYVHKMNNILKIITKIGTEKNKLVAITETGFGGLKDSTWWTAVLLPILKQYNLSYMLVWRNTDRMPNHYFAPYPGQKSADDFKKFYKDKQTLFIKDIKRFR